MKKFLATAAATVFAVAAMVPACFSASAADNDAVTVDGNTMYNDSIKIGVDQNTGCLLAYTTKGDPDNDKDDDKKLLYQGNLYNTTFDTFAIDGKAYSAKELNLSQEEEPVFDAATKSCTVKNSIDGIEFTRKYSFVKSVATGREDMIKMECFAKNTTADEHTVGLRMLLDTMIGDNDDAPFRVPGTGSVTTEKEYTGSDIPQYFQTFNTLSDPTVVSQGVFDINSNNKPDKVQFACWERLRNNIWNYTVDTEKTFDNGRGYVDSAVDSQWDEKALAAGETRDYVMYYGLGGLVVNTDSYLQVALYGDDEAQPNDTNDAYNDITVTAYVTNASENTLSNINVQLNLPEGMVAEENTQTTIDSLSVNEGKQVSWTVHLTPSATEKTLSYSVTANDATTTSTANRDIHLPALDIAEPTEPTEPQTEAVTEAATEAETDTVADEADVADESDDDTADDEETLVYSTVTTNTTTDSVSSEDSAEVVNTGETDTTTVSLAVSASALIITAISAVVYTNRKKSTK